MSSEGLNFWIKGNIRDIIFLVNNGGDKHNILIHVCAFGHLEAVKYLIEDCGANARDENEDALRCASGGGHIGVVKYLVEDCGADARVGNDSAVRWASLNGHLEVVKYLVEKCGANARAENDWAVREACERGHFEMVKYLIEKCGAILPQVNPKYERYLIVYEKGKTRQTYVMAKRIYFWWVQVCYNTNTITGQRSMQKNYREYLSILK